MMIIFLGTFLTVATFAQEITINKMTLESDLEKSYRLETNLTEKVWIDCQSFIQGLRFGEFSEARFVLMGDEDCMDLQERIRLSLDQGQKHCLDVTDSVRWDRACD